MNVLFNLKRGEFKFTAKIFGMKFTMAIPVLKWFRTNSENADQFQM